MPEIRRSIYFRIRKLSYLKKGDVFLRENNNNNANKQGKCAIFT